MITHRRAFLLMGALLLVGIGAPSAHADEKADTLLKEVETASKAIKTLTADLNMSQVGKTPDGKEQSVKMVATLKLKKPNLAHIEFAEGEFVKTIASDGKNIFTLVPGNRYQQMKVEADGANIDTLWAAPVAMFFTGRFSLMGAESKAATTYAGKQTIGGTEYDVVQVSGAQPFTYAGRLYIAPNKMATRVELMVTPKGGGEGIKVDAVLMNIKQNVPLAAAAFAYVPPRGATGYVQPSPGEMDKKLLPVGSAAPTFALSKPTGARVELAEMLKGKKAVLVNFWFCACIACRDEFPHLQALYTELKDKGFELIALNGMDSAEAINKYIQQNNFTFPVGMKGPGDNYNASLQYRVEAYPTNYLLDSTGKIVFRSVGFDEEGLREALKKLDVK